MVAIMTIKKLLYDFPIFKHIEESEMVEIATYFQHKKVCKNTHIFRQDDELHSIYFLHKGKVKISRSDSRGREQFVNLYSDGEMFPHIGHFFNTRKYPANALVVEETTLLLIPINNLEKLLTNHPIISIILLKVMGEKLIDFQFRLEEKLLSSTYEQVIKLLLRLSTKHGVKLSTNKVLFLTPFQNIELANMIGSTRETISRIMNRLDSNNFIERDDKRRLIINIDLLKNEI